MTLLISPSEAFIMGICVQEYIDARSVDESLRFIDVMRFKLCPFLPVQNLKKRYSIPLSDLPEDVYWFPEEQPDGFMSGRSPSAPSTGFFTNGKNAYKEVIDYSRKQLPQLIMSHVYEFVSLSPIEKTEYPPREGFDASAHEMAMLEAVHNGQASPQSIYHANAADEDHNAIVSRLEELARLNSCSRFFDLGRQFGGLHHSALTCDRLSKKQLSGFFDEYRQSLGSLLKNELVNESEYVASVLQWEYETRDVDVLARFEDESEHLLDWAHGRLFFLGQSLGVCVGALLERFRMLDLALPGKAGNTSSTRMFALGPDSSIDRVGGQLELLLSQMNGGAHSVLPGESIVSMLTNGIEALTKRVWARELVDKNCREPLREFLANKMRHEHGLEKRFAEVAFSLHRLFRNVGTHDLGDPSFECSYDEARFFYAGMFVLYRLCRQLEQRD